MAQETCPACWEVFSGTSAGDMHRVGKHHIFAGPERRRCLSVAEMEARGMARDKRGVWRNPSTEARERLKERRNIAF